MRFIHMKFTRRGTWELKSYQIANNLYRVVGFWHTFWSHLIFKNLSLSSLFVWIQYFNICPDTLVSFMFIHSLSLSRCTNATFPWGTKGSSFQFNTYPFFKRRNRVEYSLLHELTLSKDCSSIIQQSVSWISRLKDSKQTFFFFLQGRCSSLSVLKALTV